MDRVGRSLTIKDGICMQLSSVIDSLAVVKRLFWQLRNMSTRKKWPLEREVATNRVSSFEDKRGDLEIWCSAYTFLVNHFTISSMLRHGSLLGKTPTKFKAFSHANNTVFSPGKTKSKYE